MATSLYIITVWIIIGITSIFSLFFIFVSIPKIKELKNYRIARYVMAFTYMVLGIMNVVKLLIPTENMDYQLNKMIALLVSMIQAFLFTYSNITLINSYFVTRRKIIMESIPIALFCVFMFAYSSLPAEPANILHYAFVAYYVSVLFRYTYLFQKNYQTCLYNMNNFYSAQEFKRIRWVGYSFYSALLIGIMALLVNVFFSMAVRLSFAFMVIGFYSYYAVQFINYAFIFRHIKSVVAQTNDLSTVEHTKSIPVDHAALETAVNNWIEQKHFLSPCITMEDVCRQLSTNRTYLSAYINNCLQKNFKEWISEMRMEEAKKILLDNPEISIQEACEMAGFNDKSNFAKQFAKHTGSSPKQWRDAMMEINAYTQ